MSKVAAGTLEELYILGTNVHAFELIEIIARANEAEPRWRLKGFVSANPDKVRDRLRDWEVVTWEELCERHPDARVVPDATRPIPSEIPRERFATVIDPSARVAESARIGRGCVVYPQCSIGHNVHVGDWFWCLSGSVVGQGVVVEDQVSVASGVLVGSHVHVERRSRLGQGSMVKDGVTVGTRGWLGMGCVVEEDVPPGMVMVGSPARVLRARREDEV